MALIQLRNRFKDLPREDQFMFNQLYKKKELVNARYFITAMHDAGLVEDVQVAMHAPVDARYNSEDFTRDENVHWYGIA